MAQATSDHIKPCNIGQSEAHNRRSAEYLAHINKDAIYIRADLSYRNEAWVSDVIGKSSLQEYHNLIAQMVKEKTGRALQAKSRERVDKKTGKVKIVNGSSPIRESVIVCKEDTTIDELNRYAKLCHDTWGITALQIFIHRDEAHYEIPHDHTSWKPNYHAHIVWDWMNHDTGKSIKLSKQDTSQMQDLVAVALGMERGKRKEDTNREHLERNDFILAKQKQEAEQAKAEKIAAQTERDAAVRETDKAKTEQEKLQAGNEEKQRRSAELESEIADKEERARKADRENTDSIKSGIANLLGKGKYAAIEKENQELKQSIPKEKERLNEEFARRLEKELTRRTTEFAEREVGYKRQQEKLRQENGSLAAKYEAALQSRQEADRRTANRLKWCDAVLYRLADALYRAGELFRKIIDAIIDFARSGFGGNGSHGDIFHDDEAARIKEFMNEYAETREEMLAIGNWLVGYSGIKGRLSSQERNRAQKEVDDVAKGRYDWRIERKRNNSLCKA